jgi:hypothetical protein
MRCAALLLSAGVSFICVPAVFAHAQVPAAPAPPIRERYANYVDEAALRFGIPAQWIDAVIRAESFCDAAATSPKGAMGLMQIVPRTWEDLRGRYGLGANPYDPHENILAGTAYLRELYDRYGPDGFLAAYNAGPGRYEAYLETGRALPSETLAYIARVNQRISLNASGGTIVDASFFPSRPTSALFSIPIGGSRTAASTADPMLDPRAISARGPQHRLGLAPQSEGLFVALSHKGAQP